MASEAGADRRSSPYERLHPQPFGARLVVGRHSGGNGRLGTAQHRGDRPGAPSRRSASRHARSGATVAPGFRPGRRGRGAGRCGGVRRPAPRPVPGRARRPRCPGSRLAVHVSPRHLRRRGRRRHRRRGLRHHHGRPRSLVLCGHGAAHRRGLLRSGLRLTAQGASADGPHLGGGPGPGDQRSGFADPGRGPRRGVRRRRLPDARHGNLRRALRADRQTGAHPGRHRP